MKTIKHFLILLCISIIPLIISNCDKETQDELDKDIYFFDVSSETSWDYWIVDNSGNYLFVNEGSSYPSEVFYKPSKDHEGYSIFLDDNGLPTRAVINDIIFVFTNHRPNLIDVAAIIPSGEVFISLDVESEFDWAITSFKNTQISNSDFFRWTGHIVGAVGCAASIALVPTGIGIPLTALSCGATLAGIVAEFLPEEYEIMGLAATEFGALTTVVGCASGQLITCATGLGSTAFALMGYAEEKMEEKDSEIELAVSLLNGDDSKYIAYYPFNGNANDESGNNYNASIVGPVLTTDRFGNENSAYLFDGNQDYIQIDSKLPIDGFPLSVCAWIKPLEFSNDKINYIYASDDWDHYWGNYKGFCLALRSDGYISAHYGNGINTSNNSFSSEPDLISLNKWQHVAAVFNGPGDVDLYINGQQVSVTESRPGANKVSFTSTPDRIGYAHDGLDRHSFNGMLDDIRIYKDILTESEIGKIFAEIE